MEHTETFKLKKQCPEVTVIHISVNVLGEGTS